MKLPFRNLWAEFKKFAFQGNMIELAVAVVIGGAFSNVIHAVVSDVINPSISYAVSGARAVKDTSTTLVHDAAVKVGATTEPTTKPATQPTTEPVAAVVPPTPVAPATPPAPPAKPDEPAKAVEIDWVVGRYPVGHLVGELLNFLIIAFAVFVLIVKLLGGTMKRLGSKPAEPTEPTSKECPECLSTIPYRAKRCAHCTSAQPPLEAMV